MLEGGTLRWVRMGGRPEGGCCEVKEGSSVRRHRAHTKKMGGGRRVEKRGSTVKEESGARE